MVKPDPPDPDDPDRLIPADEQFYDCTAEWDFRFAFFFRTAAVQALTVNA